jgi:hypothetical protein
LRQGAAVGGLASVVAITVYYGVEVLFDGDAWRGNATRYLLRVRSFLSEITEEALASRNRRSRTPNGRECPCTALAAMASGDGDRSR